MLSIFNREKEKAALIIISFSIALCFVIFLWGFWNNGPYALGINFTVFWFLILTLLSKIYPEKKLFSKKNWPWLTPIILIFLSNAIYNNPFVKIFALLLTPFLILIFYNYGQLENRKEKHWSLKIIFSFAGRIGQVFLKLGESFSSYQNLIIKKGAENKSIAARVIIGIVVFLIFAIVIVIPLLSSADRIFSEKINFVYFWLKEIFSLTLIAKFVVFSFLSVFFLATGLAWKTPFQYDGKVKDKKIDSIISGIFIGGVLLLYLMFLAIQASRLWTNTLPLDFKTTEELVKSGFWQLLALSVINVFIFIASFRKTNGIVRGILGAFTAASILLLASAGQRMLLYVTNYGFSYEKFYASYTVVFCAVLFLWLMYRLFKKERADIVKFIAFLFLWMFSAIAVFPAEEFILRANLALAKREDTRINLYELKMLSPDVYNLVKEKKDAELNKVNRNAVKKNLKQKGMETGYVNDEKNIDKEINNEWQAWLEEKNAILSEKKWYEKTLTDLLIKL